MLLGVLVLAAVLGLIPAAVASAKGRSFGLWWLFGALLFIVALPCALLIRRDQQAVDAQASRDMDGRKCPWCAEIIRREAVVCRYCGRAVEPVDQSSTSSVARRGLIGEPRPPMEILQRVGLAAALFVGLIVVLVLISSVIGQSGSTVPKQAASAAKPASVDQALWREQPDGTRKLNLALMCAGALQSALEGEPAVRDGAAISQPWSIQTARRAPTRAQCAWFGPTGHGGRIVVQVRCADGQQDSCARGLSIVDGGVERAL